MSIIFDTSLNDFCRKYCIANSAVTTHEKLFLPSIFNGLLANLFEYFLLFDKISFKVYGENIPLAILINKLGFKNVEILIEQNAFEFMLWTPMIVHMVSEIKGLNPLASGNHTSPAHSDPEASIQYGLKFLKNPVLNKRQKQILTKKLRDNYKIPNEKLSHQSVDIVQQAYCSNKLSSVGMPFEKELQDLNLYGRKKLCGYADSLLETILLSEYKYTSFNNYHYAISKESIESIKLALKISTNFSKIISIENIPDIKTLYSDKKIDFCDIQKIRNKRISKNFRKWLSTVSNNVNGQEISLAYLNAITEKGFFETKTGKFLKSTSLFSAGAAVGHFIDGAHGLLFGIPIALLGKPADYALDLLDTYILDGLLKGWHPRLFFDEIRSKINA